MFLSDIHPTAGVTDVRRVPCLVCLLSCVVCHVSFVVCCLSFRTRRAPLWSPRMLTRVYNYANDHANDRPDHLATGYPFVTVVGRIALAAAAPYLSDHRTSVLLVVAPANQLVTQSMRQELLERCECCWSTIVYWLTCSSTLGEKTSHSRNR